MIIDRKKMIDTAVSYFLAAERCTPELGFGNYPLHSVFAPTVMCYAHAIEISIKLILHLVCERFPSGHNLIKLFNELPHLQKKRLFKVEEWLSEKRVEGFQFEGELEGFKIEGSSTSNVPSCDWRYPYEGKSLIAYSDDLRRSFIELHKEIRTLAPDLVSSYEHEWGHFNPDWDWAWYEEEIKEINEMREAE